MRIAVFGTGYVGLVAGTCLADSGNEVVCIDSVADRIAGLQQGRIPIHEPGLAQLVRKNAAEGRLRFTTEPGPAVAGAELVFIAVGTPEGENGDADLRHVLRAARQIAEAVRSYTIVVTKSTVPVGTGDQLRAVIRSLTNVPVDVVSNPEFMKEGAAIEDFFQPDRVVIGTDSGRARKVMAELYAPFVRDGNPILQMDLRSAELTKYAANAMLATRISFMNDLALLCERVGADVELVREGMGCDRRIGHPFLFPGIGYGGSCFPRDVKALMATGRQQGLELELLQAVERTNRRQKRELVRKAVQHFRELDGKLFALWGLAFKPRTDDMREAPSVEIIEELVGKGARVSVWDPVAMEVARRRFGERVVYAPGMYEAIEGADALCVVTEWNEFRHPDLDRMKALMRELVILDGRNLFDPGAMRASGFAYYGIGRR